MSLEQAPQGIFPIVVDGIAYNVVLALNPGLGGVHEDAVGLGRRQEYVHGGKSYGKAMTIIPLDRFDQFPSRYAEVIQASGLTPALFQNLRTELNNRIREVQGELDAAVRGALYMLIILEAKYS